MRTLTLNRLAVRRAVPWVLWLGAAACATGSASGRDAGGTYPVRIERTVFLMGTYATFVAETVDRQTGLAKLERMVRVIEETEAELSTWRDDSVLSAVNGQPVGTPLPVPAAICGLFSRIAQWHAATDGAFDPAVGNLIKAWGLRGEGREPGDREALAALAASGFDKLVLDAVSCAVTRRAAVILDAGGFGKGEALDRVREAERDRRGAWFIDFGGQVAVSGESSDGPWSVGLAHPAQRQKAVLEFTLVAGSIATSSGSERDRVTGDGRRIGHIVDPRNGRPVNRTGSVTVWHENAFVADVLSTALYVMGRKEGIAWAAPRGIAACFSSADPHSGDVAFRATPAFKARFPLPDSPWGDEEKND